MIIEGINVLGEFETPHNPPFHYCRPFEIVTDRGNIAVPCRTVNRSEYIARSSIPLLKTLPDDIVSDFTTLDQNTVNSFWNNDTTGKRLVGTIRQFNDITARSKLRISIFQPAENVLDCWKSTEKIKFAEQQAEYLHHKSGNTLVTYPYLKLPTSEYLEFIKEKYSHNEQYSIIFTLDMKMEPMKLEKILQYLESMQRPMIVALINRKWSNTIPQHSIVNSFFKNTRMIFMACQVERADEEIGHVSNMHATALCTNFDIVALKQARGFPIKQSLKLNKIKFYSPQSLTIDSIKPVLSHGRNLISELELEPDNFLDLQYVERIINGHNGGSVHPKKYQILLYLSKVHEAIASASVFVKEQEDILKKNISEHIRSTELIKVPMVSEKRG